MSTDNARTGKTRLGYHIVSIEEIRNCPGEWIFADGGVLFDGLNAPSRSIYGGGWAWVQVKDGAIVRQDSGVLTPRQTGLESVTNNLTELYALVSGLSKLPEDWRGTIVSDSHVTLCRRFPKSKFNNVPEKFAAYARRQFAQRLNTCRFVLVDGHPNDEQLEKGEGKRGGPVSKWNRVCHEECDRRHAEWLEANAALIDRPLETPKPAEKTVSWTDLSEIAFEDLL